MFGYQLAGLYLANRMPLKRGAFAVPHLEHSASCNLNLPRVMQFAMNEPAIGLLMFVGVAVLVFRGASLFGLALAFAFLNAADQFVNLALDELRVVMHQSRQGLFDLAFGDIPISFGHQVAHVAFPVSGFCRWFRLALGFDWVRFEDFSELRIASVTPTTTAALPPRSKPTVLAVGAPAKAGGKSGITEPDALNP
ncbi:MAG TPA: hypothetical protein VNX46_08305 [Candidatus Acidoferrum sp.]|nr:hypothetical protein [Candidatus Acidoferrum sp.]